MVQIEEDVREKVKNLLRELFQFDNQDLDFGIYRIMNFKRKEIVKFIEEDLITEAEKQFKEFSQARQDSLRNEIEKLKSEIIRDFGVETIDEQGNVMKHSDAPKIKEYLKRIEELKSAAVSEAQMKEVFNHVYEFFSRYYDKGDFISKRRYGGREKYYVPYNGEEVVLHWANKDQYYVKTAEFFRNYHYKAGGHRVNFLIREANVEVNNVLGKNKYFVLCDSDFVKIDDAKKIIDIYFEWRALTHEEERTFGKRNVQDTLVVDAVDRIFSETSGSSVGGLLRVKENGEKTVLEKHLENYVRRNTTDYFIHKNLKAFLERELEFYIKNEVVDIGELENLDERSLRIALAKVKAIRGISRKIIEFLAQIEDFQKMLFEKKKFIIGTEYVLTLDKIKEYAGEEFLESTVDDILKNTRQLEEWKEILGIEVKGKIDLVERQTIDGKEWKKLPLDTRHLGIGFKTKLLEALSERNNLDEILDGILMKSENWQALSLLLNKFNGEVQCIYIDPPFNTGTNEFLYKNNYLDSSWASMIYDRLALGRQLLSDNGCIYVRIDHHGNFIVRLIMDSVFGKGNFRNEIIARRGRSKAGLLGQFEDIKSLAVAYDNFYWYSKNEETRFAKFWKEASEEQKVSGKWHTFYKKSPDRPRMQYELLGVKINKGQWKRGKARAMAAVKNYAEYLDTSKKTGETLEEYWTRKGGNLEFVRKEDNGVIKFWVPPREKILRDNDWMVIPGYSSHWEFETENSEIVVQQTIEATSKMRDLVMDFFLGSGTTTAVAHKLGRKWIGVEMGDYFDNIPLKRMKAILAGEQSGISKDIGWKGGGFFKYHYVEQYEDTLSNIVFLEKDKTVQETLDEFGEYILKNMLEFETRGSPTRLNVEQFQTSFDYKIWVTTAGEKRLSTVDLVETFNYLLGITVEKLRTFRNQEKEYRCIFGKLNQENVAIIWRNTQNIDLKKDKEFIENTILTETKPDRIFINGDSLVEKAEPIEPEFKRLMGA